MQKATTTPSVPVTVALTGERRVKVIMFCVIVFFYWMALYLYVPTLPTYAQTKTSSLALIGTILAQYGLWQAIIRLPVGIASDWVGRRKPFILVGMLLAGAGAYVMGSAGRCAATPAGSSDHRSGGRHLGAAGGRVQQPVPTGRGGSSQRHVDARRDRWGACWRRR